METVSIERTEFDMKSQRVPVGYIEYIVSTTDNAGWACDDCGWECPDRRVLQAQKRKTQIRCGGCRQLVPVECERWDVRFRKEHLPFLDVDNVRNATWFHATDVVDWWEQLPAGVDTYFTADGRSIESVAPTEEGDLMVHIGTRDAALDRALAQSTLDIWLHEVRLRPDTDIRDGVWEDEVTSFPERSGHCTSGPWLGDGVTRYLNRYEMPGSVSLLANPRNLELVSRKRMTLKPLY